MPSPRSPKIEPSRAELEQYFHYTEELFFDGRREYRGGLRWREDVISNRPVVRSRLNRFGTTFAGGVFSHKKSGVEYPVICVPGRGYFLTHRLVWVWHHGPLDPTVVVDHRDRNTFHNIVHNLRATARHENSKNRSRRANAPTPYVGVSACGASRYKATASMNGTSITLGRFDCPRAAAMARDLYVRNAYDGFANYNFPDLMEIL